jgi:hypothetical protein
MLKCDKVSGFLAERDILPLKESSSEKLISPLTERLSQSIREGT